MSGKVIYIGGMEPSIASSVLKSNNFLTGRVDVHRTLLPMTRLVGDYVKAFAFDYNTKPSYQNPHTLKFVRGNIKKSKHNKARRLRFLARQKKK